MIEAAFDNLKKSLVYILVVVLKENFVFYFYTETDSKPLKFTL